MNELLPSPEADGLTQTRSSLIGRLAAWNDSLAWSTFFETYWRLIFRCALKEGLTEDEAQGVVQDTMITVAKKIRSGEYRHKPEVARFKSWLCRIVHYLVLRVKRRRHVRSQRIAEVKPADDDEDGGGPLEQFADSTNPHEAEWDREWFQNFVDVAAELVKLRVKPAHYQIFACRVIQGQSVAQTARDLAVSIPQVYLVTHRLTRLLREEFEKLRENQPILPAAVSQTTVVDVPDGHCRPPPDPKG